MERWLSLAALAVACGHAGGDARRAAATAPDPGRASDAEIAVRAAPFVDAFSNVTAVLVPEAKDGKDGHGEQGGQVVFVSTRDGLPQLYVGSLGEPDRPPRRLPVLPERAMAPRLLPDGK